MSAKASSDRAARMATMYRQGITLAAIGEKYGVTRERVRQIRKLAGITAEDGGAFKRSNDRRAAAALQRDARRAMVAAAWGVSYDELCRLKKNGTVQRFRTQRTNARARAIPFLLTFDQWLRVWSESGKLHLCGRGKDNYCMTRFGDDGAYAVGNVEIKPHPANCSEARGHSRPRRHGPEANVHRLYPGTDKPWVAKYGKRFLGRFATEAEGIAAKAAVLEAA